MWGPSKNTPRPRPNVGASPTRSKPAASPSPPLQPSTGAKTGLAILLGSAALAAAFNTSLSQSEGDKLVGYRDFARQIATACRGVTGPGVVVGRVYTPAQCDAMNEASAITHVKAVQACTPSLTGKPLVAATLLTYNIGADAYCHSTAASRFRAGDLRGGCDAMMLWDKAVVRGAKVVIPGLVARRQREHAICIGDLK